MSFNNQRIPFRLMAALLASVPAASLSLSSGPALAQAHDPGTVREIEIVVQGAYKPARIEIRQGERVRLKFVRKEYNSCTREVVFPKLNIKRELPPNQPVVIDLPALAPGEYEFKCGMSMIKGVITVVPHAH